MAIEQIIIPAIIALSGSTSAQDATKYQVFAHVSVPQDTILTKDEIFRRVKQIITEIVSVEPSDIKVYSNFTSDLGMDSLDIVEAIFGIERKFEISVADDFLNNVKTVSDLVDYIHNSLTNSVKLFSDKNFIGKQLNATGDITPYRFPAESIIEHGLSSIIVPKGYCVTLFTIYNFKGENLVITADTEEIRIPDLSNISNNPHLKLSVKNFNFEDKIVSMTIKKLP